MNMSAWSAINISTWGPAISGLPANRSALSASMDGKDIIGIGADMRFTMTVIDRTATGTLNRAEVNRSDGMTSTNGTNQEIKEDIFAQKNPRRELRVFRLRMPVATKIRPARVDTPKVSAK
jgi:hypothetical protein